MKAAASMLGVTDDQGKDDQKKKDEDDLDDALFYNNPITKSLVELKNNLDLMASDEVEDEENSIGIQIKQEICDLLNFLIDLRQNFLVQNCICWFEEYEQQFPHKERIKKSFWQRLRGRIKDDLCTVLPGIMLTGDEGIDMQIFFQQERNI